MDIYLTAKRQVNYTMLSMRFEARGVGKNNANELRRISWLLEEISLRKNFPRTKLRTIFRCGR